jgi:ATP-dependent helicase/nuclease subunit B
LPGGGLAVIDYKSGNVVPPARWFAERPEGIQVAIYATAVESAAHEPVRALVYAQVKAGDIDVAGLAEDNAQWPALAAVDSPRLALAGWADARAQLAARVHALARDIRDGIADVAPRTQAICGYCGLQPLCRVQRLDDGASAEQTRDE